MSYVATATVWTIISSNGKWEPYKTFR
eukprot:COSAG01_NODE_53126_length_341_cov_0.917355_1_plen_26_part_01